MSYVLLTRENIARLEELIPAKFYELSFLVPRHEQSWAVPFLGIRGVLSGLSAELLQICRERNYQYWFQYDGRQLRFYVAGTEADRMKAVEQWLANLGPGIERLNAGKAPFLAFDVHPLDFRYRTLITASPRWLKGPTRVLYIGLKATGQFRLKVIHNFWGSDVIIAYGRPRRRWW